MKNLKLILKYDGTNFFGSQRQKNNRSVQGEIENCFHKIFKQTISMNFSGRTDRHVHALGQVANFLTALDITCEDLKYIFNKKLPSDIEIKEISQVDLNFHARYSAKNKTYLYLMKTKEKINVFEKNYVTSIKDEIDIEKFNKIILSIKGKHDFTNFRKTDKKIQTNVREVHEINLDKKNDFYIFKITGNGFLKSMVRIIVEEGLREYFAQEKEGHILNRLNIFDKKALKHVAKPNGLYLYKIEYLKK